MLGRLAAVMASIKQQSDAVQMKKLLKQDVLKTGSLSQAFFVTVLSGFVPGCCLKSCFYVWVGMIARTEKLNSN